jgi:hypothetical protein
VFKKGDKSLRVKSAILQGPICKKYFMAKKLCVETVAPNAFASGHHQKTKGNTFKQSIPAHCIFQPEHLFAGSMRLSKLKN